MRRPFSVRRVLLACVVGAIVGVGAFLLTSQQNDGINIGLCHPVIEAGFNPWTGLPYGATWSGEQIPLVSCGPARQDPAPPDIATRQAIPVPLGFVVGAAAVFLSLRVRGPRRRGPATAVPSG